MNIPRFSRRKGGESNRAVEHGDEYHVVQIDVDELSAVFSAPRWPRDLGLASWFLVGVAALLSHRHHWGGALFGMVGLVLAAPLTSAAVHISADLARARTAAAREAEAAEPEPAPG